MTSTSYYPMLLATTSPSRSSLENLVHDWEGIKGFHPATLRNKRHIPNKRSQFRHPEKKTTINNKTSLVTTNYQHSWITFEAEPMCRIKQFVKIPRSLETETVFDNQKYERVEKNRMKENLQFESTSILFALEKKKINRPEVLMNEGIRSGCSVHW